MQTTRASVTSPNSSHPRPRGLLYAEYRGEHLELYGADTNEPGLLSALSELYGRGYSHRGSFAMQRVL